MIERPSSDFIASLTMPFLGQGTPVVRPVHGKGIVNHVYVLNQSGIKLVARLNNNRAADEFLKEEWCIGKAEALGIPSPEVLDVGKRDGWHYMLLSHAGDLNGTDYHDQPELWEWLGKQAAKLHAIETSAFGESLEDLSASESNDGWQKYISYNLDCLNPDDPLLRLEVYSLKQQNTLRSLFKSLAGRNHSLSLCHGDLSPRNIVIDENNVFTLIDWGSAASHITPHYDMIECINRHGVDSVEITAFCKGYGLTEACYDHIKTELKELMVLRAIDLVRYAMDRVPHELPEKIKDCRKTFSQFGLS